MDTDQEPKGRRPRVQYKSYGPSAMEQAMGAVQREGKSVYRAARDWEVPMNTLRDRLIAKGVLKPKHSGKRSKNKVTAEQAREKAAIAADLIEDSSVMERWQNISKAEGLTTFAAVAAFLVSLYYSSGKQGERQKTAVDCQRCHKPLTALCADCQLLPGPSKPSPQGDSLPSGPLLTSTVAISRPDLRDSPFKLTDPKSKKTGVTVSPVRRSKRSLLNKKSREVEVLQKEMVHNVKASRTKRSFQSCGVSETIKEGEISQNEMDRNVKSSRMKRSLQSPRTSKAILEVELSQNEMVQIVKASRSRRSLQFCKTGKTFRDVEPLPSDTVKSVESLQRECETLRESLVASDDDQPTPDEEKLTVDTSPDSKKEDSHKNSTTKTNNTNHPTKLNKPAKLDDPALPMDDFIQNMAFLQDLKNEEDEEGEDNKKAKKVMMRECPECGGQFEDSVTLQQHFDTTQHSPMYVCQQCSKPFKTKSGYLQHQRVHRRQQQQCSVCGLSFRFPSRLSKHLKTHSADRPHICDKCGKSFTSVYYLKDHIQIHSEDRSHKCEVCGARFKQKPALYAHGKIHSKDKPYQCQYCGLKYRDAQKMKIHVRSHTGEKPYPCPMCDAHFVSNSNMWQHLAYVHGKSTKSHQCPHCPLTFAAKGKLKIHLKNIHQPGSESCERGKGTGGEDTKVTSVYLANVNVHLAGSEMGGGGDSHAPVYLKSIQQTGSGRGGGGADSEPVSAYFIKTDGAPADSNGFSHMKNTHLTGSVRDGGVDSDGSVYHKHVHHTRSDRVVGADFGSELGSVYCIRNAGSDSGSVYLKNVHPAGSDRRRGANPEPGSSYCIKTERRCTDSGTVNLQNIHLPGSDQGGDSESEPGPSYCVGGTERGVVGVGVVDVGGAGCQFEVVSAGAQPVFVELSRAANAEDQEGPSESDASHTSLTSVGALCHVSMSL